MCALRCSRIDSGSNTQQSRYSEGGTHAADMLDSTAAAAGVACLETHRCRC